MKRRATSAQTAIDEHHMARALELARRHRGRTAPNPIVGCVIVDAKGKVLAEGAHARAGTGHAEAVALAALAARGGKAKGATLYVTLEPCNHHGRTPPCAPAVRDAGVSRVVIGMMDPIASHSGGAALLRRAKIAVTTGVLAAECARANRHWSVFATEERSAFTVKAALTLDGKIATVAGDSKWVTGPAAREDVHRERDAHDAILVGIDTVLADDPWLTARGPKLRSPVRIVLDSKLRTPVTAHVLPKSTRGAPRTIIVAGKDAPVTRERALRARNAEVWRMPQHRNGRIDLLALAHRLAMEKIVSVLVEGGAEVHASLITQRLADHFLLYIAPKVVGGPARSWVGGAGMRLMSGATRLVLDPVIEELAGDLKLTGVLAPLAPTPAFEGE